MRKWLIIIAVIILVGGGAYYFGIYRPAGQAASASDLQIQNAARGSLTATVGATGIVHANQTATLSWQTSGTVGEVNVQIGDQVTTGSVLASLERTSLPQTVILAQADLVNAQKALDDLMNSQLQQAKAQQAVEDARKALEDAQNPDLVEAKAAQAVADAQKTVDEAERNLRWAKSPASQSYIDEAKSQVVLTKDQLDKAKEKFGPYANKSEDNVTRARLQSEMAAAQQRYDAAVRQLNNLQGTTNETDISVLEANVATAKAQLLEAQRDYERKKDGTSPAELALLEAQLEEANREWERIKDGPDPQDVEAARARVAAAQATLNQAQLTAPIDGVVTDVISKPGDQVSPGAPAFRLDDLSHLLIDVQVSEVDINKIRPGQTVNLTFDAILDKEYNGVVNQVDVVGTTNQGVVDFTVTVELTDADQAVKTGMTAAVNIVVNELQDVLLVPNRAVRVLEGERVVYVLKDGRAQPVNITLGASSDTVSEVIDGDLKEGDPIVLNPPTVFDQNGPPPFVRGQ
jgi:HlyD family secretion protein